MKRIVIIFLLFPVMCISQDIHFSDILHHKILINPSLSSSPSEVNTAGFIYRNQGKSMTVPYKTYGLWLDNTVNLKFLKNDKAGYAITATNDIAGDGNLQEIRLLLSGSYTKFLIDKNFAVSLGYGIGVTNRSVDFTKLTFASQWNGHSFDPAAPQNEAYSSSSLFYLDMNAGISAFYKVSDIIQFDGGIAIDHIREPKETFYISDNQLSRKISFFTSSLIRRESLLFYPGAILIFQSGNKEIIFGTDILYRVSDFILGGGLWYRWNSDIIPSIKIARGKFELTMAYDTNIGVMHPASMYRGGMEVSVRMTMGKEKFNKYDCEEMEF